VAGEKTGADADRIGEEKKKKTQRKQKQLYK
jgi:hypothetical protein